MKKHTLKKALHMRLNYFITIFRLCQHPKVNFLQFYLLSNAFFKSSMYLFCCFFRNIFTKGFINAFLAFTSSVNSTCVPFSVSLKTPLQCPFIFSFSKSNSRRRQLSLQVTVKSVAKPSLEYSVNLRGSSYSILLISLLHL